MNISASEWKKQGVKMGLLESDRAGRRNRRAAVPCAAAASSPSNNKGAVHCWNSLTRKRGGENEGIKSRRGVMERGREEGRGQSCKITPLHFGRYAAHPIGGDVAMWPRTKTILMFFAPTAVFHKRDYSVENERGNVKAGTISYGRPRPSRLRCKRGLGRSVERESLER